MSKHTPGPWESHNGEVTTQQISGRSYRRIAAVQDYGVGSLPEVDEANARLIAAAPKLLEALEYCQKYFRAIDEMQPHRKHGREGDVVRQFVSQAIAKATGQPQP